MKDYLLFVDTETSGLPKDWSKPYSAVDNWPYIVQLAWVVYTKEGNAVKSENHYIKPVDYSISDISRQIHGISDAFLMEHGKTRKEVMQLIYQDLLYYQPLVVGHFMQLDYHMLGLGFYRAGLENPLKELATFCTMQFTSNFYRESGHKYLRLNQLYERLFGVAMQQQHNALADATATARCFFEMRKRGDITEEIMAQQKRSYKLEEKGRNNWVSKQSMMYVLLLLLVLLLFIFLNYDLHE